MAHTENMLVGGVLTPVTVFDSSAQEIDDAVNAFKQGAAGSSASYTAKVESDILYLNCGSTSANMAATVSNNILYLA